MALSSYLLKWKIILFCCVVPVLFSSSGLGQTPNGNLRSSVPDSVAVKAGLLVILPDSFFVAAGDTVIPTNGKRIRLRIDPYARTRLFYDSLAAHAGRRPLPAVLYRLFVRDNDPVRRTAKNDKARESDFRPYEGKTVRSIQTLHVPILDGDVNDTSWADTSLFGRWLNLLPQTRPYVIRSRRIVSTGKKVSARRLADMERLVREFRTIRDARLYVRPVAGTDSIDLVMATQDIFPLRLNIDFRSADLFKLRLNDRNIAGSAVEAGLSYAYDGSLEKPRSTTLSLRQINMFNRFIDGSFYMERSGDRSATGFSMERPYLTTALPEIGGVYFNKVNDRFRSDTLSRYYHLLTTGAWYGHVIRVGSSIELIPAIAWEANIHPEGTAAVVNLDYETGSRQAGLFSLNLIRRRFLRTALVNAAGVSEYVPVGWLVNVTTGAETIQPASRNYTGATLQGASFIKDAGYFAVTVSAGQHYRSGITEDRIFEAGLLYYTPLLRWGRVRFRQFVEANGRFAGDLSRYGNYRLQGSWVTPEGDIPYGTISQSVALRSVVFMPWYLYGFRCSVYDVLALDRIGDPCRNDNPIRDYPSVAIGLRMQNDFLAYSALSLQVRFAPAVNGYSSYFSVTLKSLVLPLFRGLEAGRPRMLTTAE